MIVIREKENDTSMVDEDTPQMTRQGNHLISKRDEIFSLFFPFLFFFFFFKLFGFFFVVVVLFCSVLFSVVDYELTLAEALIGYKFSFKHMDGRTIVVKVLFFSFISLQQTFPFPFSSANTTTTQ